ncbi:MAG: DUF4976 domain-containing protein [Pirellulales bacterium]
MRVRELTDEVKQQIEGKSILPLLKQPSTTWLDRMLVHHVGRWGSDKPIENFKHQNCSIQTSRYTLVGNKELYDLQSDPGETKNVIADHPEVVADLRSAYDKWWSDVQPFLVNEMVVGPRINPFKELY